MPNPFTKYEIKELMDIVGYLLFYGHTIDFTLLVALIDMEF